MAETPCSQCKGPRLDPWSGNSSHTSQLRVHMLQLKKLLYSIGNNQQMERQFVECEKVFAYYVSDKGLITKIYRELQHVNRKKQISRFKSGHRA